MITCNASEYQFSHSLFFRQMADRSIICISFQLSRVEVVDAAVN
jgi:hypothetical protein